MRIPKQPMAPDDKEDEDDRSVAGVGGGEVETRTPCSAAGRRGSPQRADLGSSLGSGRAVRRRPGAWAASRVSRTGRPGSGRERAWRAPDRGQRRRRRAAKGCARRPWRYRPPPPRRYGPRSAPSPGCRRRRGSGRRPVRRGRGGISRLMKRPALSCALARSSSGAVTLSARPRISPAITSARRAASAGRAARVDPEEAGVHVGFGEGVDGVGEPQALARLLEEARGHPPPRHSAKRRKAKWSGSTTAGPGRTKTTCACSSLRRSALAPPVNAAGAAASASTAGGAAAKKGLGLV